jgi:phosphoribosylformylglycinamidine synthase
MNVKVAIIVFPGSNCDHDAYFAFKKIFNVPTEFVWHKETNLDPYDIIVLPGGFSYGDYLRCGAIARFSPVMKEVVEKAKLGVKIIGICNGFQILTESGLLPGALTMNKTGNVLGMMPHPERNAEQILGNSDGKKILSSLLDSINRN